MISGKGCWHAYVSQLGTKSAGQELIWSLDKPYPILTLTERWARRQRCHAYGCAMQPHPHHVCKRLHDGSKRISGQFIYLFIFLQLLINIIIGIQDTRIEMNAHYYLHPYFNIYMHQIILLLLLLFYSIIDCAH